MPDYDKEIRSAVAEMIGPSPAAKLLDTEYKRSLDCLVNDAVRVCREADGYEGKRFGLQSAITSTTFGYPGQWLVRPVAMLVSQAIVELHYHKTTAMANGAGNVSNAWVTQLLNGNIAVKEAP